MVGAKFFTGWPSTSKIVSPGRKPAFHAGPSGPPSRSLWNCRSRCSACRRPRPRTAKTTASRKLNNGPANATMILSSGETLGNCSVGVSDLAFDGLHGGHLRQGDVAAGGIQPSAYSTPLIFRLPDRLAKPDGKAIDLQAAPFRRQKMPQLVDADEQVEKQHHFQRDKNVPQNGHVIPPPNTGTN